MSAQSKARYAARVLSTQIGWIAKSLPPMSIEQIKALSPEQIEERYASFRGLPIRVGGQR